MRSGFADNRRVSLTAVKLRKLENNLRETVLRRTASFMIKAHTLILLGQSSHTFIVFGSPEAAST